MKKIIIIIVVALVVAGAAVYFLFMQPPPEPDIINFSPGESFVTNIKDSARLLKVTVVLEISTLEAEKVTEYLTANSHIIRDIIIFSLREKTEDELRSSGIEETLRKEITAKLSSDMGIDYITTIYFNDYVVQ